MSCLQVSVGVTWRRQTSWLSHFQKIANEEIGTVHRMFLRGIHHWIIFRECWNHPVWKLLKWQGQKTLSLDVADGSRGWIRYSLQILFYFLKICYISLCIFMLCLWVKEDKTTSPIPYSSISRVGNNLKSFLGHLKQETAPQFHRATTRWRSRSNALVCVLCHGSKIEMKSVQVHFAPPFNLLKGEQAPQGRPPPEGASS